MIEEGYDLVIRVNPDPDESLIGRVFLRDRLVVVAHPDLAIPAENVVVPAVVRGGGDNASTWEFETVSGRRTMSVEPILWLSSLLMVRDAVSAGVGAARLPISLVATDIAKGKLMHGGDVDGAEIALWALYPSRRLLSARVSAFLDHLAKAFPKGTPEVLAAYLEDSD